MIERLMRVKLADLNFRNEETYVQYMYELDKRIFDLPQDGVLYVDLHQVKFMDQEYAIRSVSALRCNEAEGTAPLKRKHLVLIEPNEQVQREIEIAVDLKAEAFMFLELGKDKDGNDCNVLRIRGKSINSTLKKVLKKILKEDRMYTATELLDSFKNGSKQLYAAACDQLYDWGLVRMTEEAERGKPGRPPQKYHAFWPAETSFWPDSNKKIVWEVDGEEFSRPKSKESKTAA